MNSEEFVSRIENLLDSQGKTKVDFVNSVGITKRAIYDWKQRGTIPAADTALKIAQYLNTTVEYLLTGSESNILAQENATLKDRLAKINELSKL